MTLPFERLYDWYRDLMDNRSGKYNCFGIFSKPPFYNYISSLKCIILVIRNKLYSLETVRDATPFTVLLEQTMTIKKKNELRR